MHWLTNKNELYIQPHKTRGSVKKYDNLSSLVRLFYLKSYIYTKPFNRYWLTIERSYADHTAYQITIPFQVKHVRVGVVYNCRKEPQIYEETLCITPSICYCLEINTEEISYLPKSAEWITWWVFFSLDHCRRLSSYPFH